MTIRNLDRLFRPTSVVVIGASAKPGGLGGTVFRNLLAGGFQGQLFGVNPRGGEVNGIKLHPSITALPLVPDLAVVVTPPDTVAGIVAELGALGCRAAVVLTAGFGEGGNAVGERRRAEILNAARPNLFRIIGPNCLGIMVPPLGLNATFARTGALPGRIALVAQSGAIASALLDWARPRGIGFSHVVTLGDMSDVDFGDMLDYLCTDEHARSILLYVEGVTHARKFMSAARRAARIKPVLVLKGGRNAETAKVATSHTGALAGSDSIYEAAFARAGLMRVDDLDDLFDGAELLSVGAAVRGNRLAILTNGGGLGVLAADRLVASGGKLARLGDETLVGLNKALPETWSHGNPVDIIGDADGPRYASALAPLLEDRENDAVLVMHCPTAAADPAAVAQSIIAECRSAPGKAILTAWTGEESVGQARRLFTEQHIPTFATPREAVNGFTQMVKYNQLQELLLETPAAFQDISALAIQEVRGILANITDSRWLSPLETKHILGLYGIPCARSAIAGSPDDVGIIARDWNRRVALKVVSPDIVHKSDVGGVILDVDPASAVAEATNLMAAVRHHAPKAAVEGILVEEMIKRPAAHELFLGMTVDATFGPALVFGQGGTGVEVIDDKAFDFPPLNETLARVMIEKTRVGKLLTGYRNRPPANLKAIVNALISLSQLVADHPQIIDLDINPLLADEQGVTVLDARVKVDPSVRASKMIISPYPRALEGALLRSHGGALFCRPLKPQDAPLVEQFARCLTADDLRSRFFTPIKVVDRQLAARLCQLDYDRELALVATPSRGSDEIYAIARFHADPDNVEAEFAVTVRSDLQRQGIGYALMKGLVDVAKSRGLKILWGDVMASNQRMLALARSLDMREGPAKEAGIVRVTLRL